MHFQSSLILIVINFWHKTDEKRGHTICPLPCYLRTGLGFLFCFPGILCILLCELKFTVIKTLEPWLYTELILMQGKSYKHRVFVPLEGNLGFLDSLTN